MTNQQDLRERIRRPILKLINDIEDATKRSPFEGDADEWAEDVVSEILALLPPPDPGSSCLLRDRVKAVREKQGLSVRALGDLTGLNFSTLARFERGEGELSIENKAALRDWLGVLEPTTPDPGPLADMQPLDADMARVWDENAAQLYEVAPDPGLASLAASSEEWIELTDLELKVAETIHECVSVNIYNDELNLAAHRVTELLCAALTTGGWQSIDSAPKDGTRVLLFVPPYGPSTGHYEPARANWGPNASLWVAHSVLNKEAGPTHWMPLPEPPTSKPDTGE